MHLGMVQVTAFCSRLLKSSYRRQNRATWCGRVATSLCCLVDTAARQDAANMLKAS